jgi:density-regulated protein
MAGGEGDLAFEVDADLLVHCACGLPPEYCGTSTREKTTAETFERQCAPWRRENADKLAALGLAAPDDAADDADGKGEEDANADGAEGETDASKPAPKQAQKKKGPQPKKVIISRLMRGKKKSVTSVTGLEAHLAAAADGGMTLTDAAKMMGKQFACAAAAKKDEEDTVVIQGDVADKLPEFLTNKLKISADQISSGKTGRLKGRPPPRKR